MGEWDLIAANLEGQAGLAILQGRPGHAAKLLGAADALRVSSSMPLAPKDRPEVETIATAAHSLLGDEAFNRAFDAGCALGWEQAASEALAAAE